jgi:hypothetical protein
MKSPEWYKAREARKKKWVGRLNYLTDRIHGIIWVLAGILVIYYSNFFLVIWENEKVNNLFFSIALITLGIFCSMTVYATFLMPSIEDIEVVAPRLIPMASVIGFMSFISTLIAVWPIWGWYTPGMLFTMLMAYLMSGSFMPKNSLGSLGFMILFIGSGFSGHFISHKGLWH